MTDVEAFERQSVPECALAVITWPNVRERPEIVHAVPEAVPEAICTPPAYNIIDAPETEVPETEVVVDKIGEVITGAAVWAPPVQKNTGLDSHWPGTV